MRTRIGVGCLILLVGIGRQTPAEANWGWLEKLSGPGPFTAEIPGLTVPVLCVRGDDEVSVFCRPSTQPRRGHVGFEFQSWESRENLLFFADPRGSFGRVRIVDFRANLMIRVHDAFEVGMGTGFHRFSGPAFDSFWRMSVEPARASIAPLALFGSNRWFRVLKIETGATRFRGEFTNEDFCTAPSCNLAQTIPFSAEGEYLWRSSAVIDLGAVLWR